MNNSSTIANQLFPINSSCNQIKNSLSIITSKTCLKYLRLPSMKGKTNTRFSCPMAKCKKKKLKKKLKLILG